MNQAITKHAVVLFGPPGSGKGTQGAALGMLPDCTFVSMGEILRSVDRDTDTGREIHEYLRKGDFVPADLVVTSWLDKMKFLVGRGFRPEQDLLVLDGLPRTRQQADLLDSHLHIQEIIHLACEDRSLLIDRIYNRRAGREDDADDDVIRHRFEVYEKETKPLLEWYPKDKIATVDAALPPMEVLGKITATLTSRDIEQEQRKAIPNTS